MPTNPDGLDDEFVLSIKEEKLKKSPKQSHLYDFICAYYLEHKKPMLLQSLANEIEVSAAQISGLVRKGLVEKVEIEVSRIEEQAIELSSKVELNLALADFQKKILSDIRNELAVGKKNVLIHGITGSGKTLIYMHLIKDVIDSGKQVIMLLPEISLTPQLTDRFKLSFPGKVCTIHSQLNRNERYELWQKISNGDYQIVIGPRSAIFSPLKRLV
jgi:primosomal protein N' (replication factor Y)